MSKPRAITTLKSVVTFFVKVFLAMPKHIWYTHFNRVQIGDGNMAIGERIHFLRNLRGMTQKYLGQAVGFPGKTADVRMAQYESGTWTPKSDLIKFLLMRWRYLPMHCKCLTSIVTLA